MNTLQGKVVIVTGAAGGIGRASALAFAREGASVVAADIDQAGADAVATLIGANAMSARIDVSDEASCKALVEAAVERFGRLDILFNNAGITGVRSLAGDMASDNWRRVIDVNLNGVFYCTQAAIPRLRAGGGGVIINTSSVDGLIGAAGVSAYVAAKHAVIGLTRTCALEYAQDKIRCVAIAPGFIKTDMVDKIMTEAELQIAKTLVPAQRIGGAEEVAELVVWLASDKAAYVTGSVHQIDGGMLAGFSMPPH